MDRAQGELLCLTEVHQKTLHKERCVGLGMLTKEWYFASSVSHLHVHLYLALIGDYCCLYSIRKLWSEERSQLQGRLEEVETQVRQLTKQLNAARRTSNKVYFTDFILNH